MKRISFVLLMTLALTASSKNLFAGGGGKWPVDESCGCFLFSTSNFDNSYNLEVTLSQNAMLSTITKFNTINCISETNSKSCPEYYKKNNLFFDKFTNKADLIDKVTFDQDEKRERLEFYVNSSASEGKELVISGYLHNKADTPPKYLILTRKDGDTTTAALMHIQLHSKVKSLEISGFDFQNLKGEAIAIFAKDLETLIIKDNSFRNVGTEGNNNPAIKIYTHTKDGKVVKNKILDVQFINNNFVNDGTYEKTAMKSPDIQIENLITGNITFKDNKFYRENRGGVYNVKFIDSDVSKIQAAIQIDVEVNQKNAFSNPNSPCKYNLFDTTDTDKDGLGDLCDNDDDNDGILESGKAISPEVKDAADNVICKEAIVEDYTKANACNGTTVCHCKDNCPLVKNPGQADANSDGTGDACSDDNDGDGIKDETDNCKNVSNPDQKDTDEDNWGDVCDPDIDNDAKVNAEDNCPTVYNPKQEDKDNDGVGDVCDKISAKTDTQPAPAPTFLGNIVNKFKSLTGSTAKVDLQKPAEETGGGTEPEDNGQGGTGDGSRTPDDGSTQPTDGGTTTPIEDKDNDGIADDSDNCIAIPNADQKDIDSNGVGDACDVEVEVVEPQDGGNVTPGGSSNTGGNSGGTTGTNAGNGADGDGALPPNGPTPTGGASLRGAGCSLVR